MSESNSSELLPLTQQETDALNKHGVFFKKRVLQELQALFGIGILAEELGVSFEQTRVIDIVAQDNRGKPALVFVFECKRAFTTEKKWIFFRDVHRRYRVCRTVGGLFGNASVFETSTPEHPPVCSEGYEYRKTSGNADQDPVFKAAGQLSAGYLGLIARRDREMRGPGTSPTDIVERYVPVLVTNAEIIVLERDFAATCLGSGNIESPPKGRIFRFIILKHPFPTPEGMARDLRDDTNPLPGPKDWSQLQKESIYVVHSSALREFMSETHRDFLRTAKSED
jgi:hypothetical protein